MKKNSTNNKRDLPKVAVFVVCPPLRHRLEKTDSKEIPFISRGVLSYRLITVYGIAFTVRHKVYRAWGPVK